MTREEIFEKLELDTPEDFAYFEQMAELMEMEGDISEDDICEVVSMVDGDTVASLIENYFEDLTNALPDDADDIVSLVDSIKQSLSLLAQNLDNKNNRAEFGKQLASFREWFLKPGGASVDGKACSIFDAATEHRAEKLGHGKHEYDFTQSLDYDLDNISLSVPYVSDYNEGDSEENGYLN